MVIRPNENSSSQEWIEWVPNISEGKDTDLIHTIVDNLDALQDVYVIHKDIGFDAHRTVLTVVGTKHGLEKALDILLELLSSRINMENHKGEHPRLGALDVSPFIPFNTNNIENTIKWTHHLAKKLSLTYNLPIYLYEKSAVLSGRKNLASIRKGEYENLKDKMNVPGWHPDYGDEFNPILGATVMGVRDFLVAYNVNLESTNHKIAKSIASAIRSRGPTNRTSALQGLKAIGWYMDTFGKAQVSTNITNTHKISLLDVFNACKEIANSYGIEVRESELIGLIPGRMLYKMTQSGNFNNWDLTQKLGLGFCGIENLQERTIEYQFMKASGIQINNLQNQA